MMKKVFKILCAILASIIIINPINYTKVDVNTVQAVEETANISIWDGSSDTSWYDSEETELHISTAEELAGFRDLVNVGQKMKGQTIYLDSDLYMNNISNYDNWETNKPKNVWEGIDGFEGCFDGRNNTIYGIYIDDGSGSSKNGLYCGFFNTSSGTLKNFSLDKEFISINIVPYRETKYDGLGAYENEKIFIDIGGICGSGTGVIENCYINCYLYNYVKFGDRANYPVSYSYNGNIGGISGSFSGQIYKCVSNGTILKISNKENNCSKEQRFGGICGKLSSGGISECANNMSGCDSGIVSETGKNTIISNCYNTTPTSNSGIVKTLGEGASINNVYNIGKTTYGISESHKNINFDSCYYLSESSTKGTAADTDPSGVIQKNEKNMKTKSFSEALGSKFLFKEGSYPILYWESIASDITKGDANNDGEVNIADLVMLHKWLLGASNELTCWQNVDLCEDNRIDIFDMVLLRRLLINE